MSLKILSIETTTNLCSAAISVGDYNISFRETPAPQQHSQLILSLLDELLGEAKLSFAQLDALAFSRGPGSFTGVRLSLNIIQAIALAWDLPIVPVSTLRALAQMAYRTHQQPHVLAALDARLDQVYWGYYQLNTQQVMGECDFEAVCGPEEVSINSAQVHSIPYVGIGSGWDRYSLQESDSFQANMKVHAPHKQPLDDTIGRKSLFQSAIPWIKNVSPHAQDIACLAHHDYQRGIQFRADTLTPHYLRNQVAQPMLTGLVNA